MLGAQCSARGIETPLGDAQHIQGIGICSCRAGVRDRHREARLASAEPGARSKKARRRRNSHSITECAGNLALPM